MPGEELDVLSKENTYSLFNLLNNCRAVQAAIEALPRELLDLTERELLKSPDDVQLRLKISFWNEFKRCQRLKIRPMVLSNILFGVCSPSYWQKKVVARQDVLAWLITPPADEVLVWQELLELGNKKIRRVLKLPLIEKRYWKDKSGEVYCEKRTNVSLVKEVRAIVENLQNRLHGAVVQRQEIQSKSVNVNIGASPKEPEKLKSAADEMAEIKKLLSRIEKVASSIPELPEAAILDGTVIPPEDDV
jgi:hypothetical protein